MLLIFYWWWEYWCELQHNAGEHKSLIVDFSLSTNIMHYIKTLKTIIKNENIQNVIRDWSNELCMQD